MEFVVCLSVFSYEKMDGADNIRSFSFMFARIQRYIFFCTTYFKFVQKIFFCTQKTDSVHKKRILYTSFVHKILHFVHKPWHLYTKYRFLHKKRGDLYITFVHKISHSVHIKPEAYTNNNTHTHTTSYTQ